MNYVEKCKGCQEPLLENLSTSGAGKLQELIPLNTCSVTKLIYDYDAYDNSANVEMHYACKKCGEKTHIVWML